MDELHINTSECLHESWEYYFFINFLKKNGIRPAQFFRNCILQNNGKRLIRFLNRTSSSGFNNIIMESFNWTRSPEGGQVWSLLYVKFLGEYNRKYNEMKRYIQTKEKETV